MGGKLSSTNSAKGVWETKDGSTVVACGVGNPPTGDGFDVIIMDDLIKSREKAESPAFRDALEDWWTDGISTRQAPKCLIVGIWTLWHEDDLAGRMDAKESEDGDEWTVIKFPAIALEDDLLGRQPGEALWPEVRNIEWLLRQQRNMMKRDGLRSWEALYQQNPTPLEGDIFNVTMLEYVDAAPQGLPTVRAWDVGAGASGDPSAGIKASGPDPDGLFYVEHDDNFRLDSAKRDHRMLANAKMDGKKCIVGIPQDPGAAGKSQVRYWMGLLMGFNVRVLRPTKDKVIRAGPASSLVNAGLVRIVRGPWNAPFVDELRTFPGRFDNRVDALSDAVEVLTSTRRLRVIKAKRKDANVDL